MAHPEHDPKYLKRDRNNEFKKIELHCIGDDDNHTYFVIKRDGKYYHTSTIGDILTDKRIQNYLMARIEPECTMYIWLVVPEDHPDIVKSGRAYEQCERPITVVTVHELDPVQVTALLL